MTTALVLEYHDLEARDTQNLKSKWRDPEHRIIVGGGLYFVYLVIWLLPDHNNIIIVVGFFFQNQQYIGPQRYDFSRLPVKRKHDMRISTTVVIQISWVRSYILSIFDHFETTFTKMCSRVC